MTGTRQYGCGFEKINRKTGQVNLPAPLMTSQFTYSVLVATHLVSVFEYLTLYHNLRFQ